MRAVYDDEADAIYVTLRDVPTVERTVQLDANRLVDYVGPDPVGVELLNARLGVMLSGLPEEAAVAEVLERDLGAYLVALHVRPGRDQLSEPRPRYRDVG